VYQIYIHSQLYKVGLLRIKDEMIGILLGVDLLLKLKSQRLSNLKLDYSKCFKLNSVKALTDARHFTLVTLKDNLKVVRLSVKYLLRLCSYFVRKRIA
jgi:hypothetical protein